jgi:hypothetical protein
MAVRLTTADVNGSQTARRTSSYDPVVPLQKRVLKNECNKLGTLDAEFVATTRVAARARKRGSLTLIEQLAEYILYYAPGDVKTKFQGLYPGIFEGKLFKYVNRDDMSRDPVPEVHAAIDGRTVVQPYVFECNQSENRCRNSNKQ